MPFVSSPASPAQIAAADEKAGMEMRKKDSGGKIHPKDAFVKGCVEINAGKELALNGIFTDPNGQNAPAKLMNGMVYFLKYIREWEVPVKEHPALMEEMTKFVQCFAPNTLAVLKYKLDMLIVEQEKFLESQKKQRDNLFKEIV